MQPRIDNRNADYIPFEDKALLGVKEMCVYLSIGQTKCRELLADPSNGFTDNINLITMQQAFNELKTDMSRKDTRRILIDMYNKAIDADLVLKNIPMQVNTVVNKDSNPEEPRVLTFEETDIFLEAAQHYRYFNTFSLALETGIRIGELLGLKWSDIDFENQTIYVNRTLVYVTYKDETSPKYGKKINEFHEPKTEKGKRKIPMTLKAYQILKRQKLWKAEIEAKGKRQRDLKTWYLLLQGMLPLVRMTRIWS